jgi:hypothetical protein
MSKDIFISYSRRDQEFVTRLASDLDAHFTGVWFDQSTIQVGENWHDEIMEGIRDCKAFILVLSPDAAESRYVHEELNKAQELHKPIFPILYRSAPWKDEIASLVTEVQTLDLRSGSYTDNFYKLVDGLIAAGAVRPDSYQKPFMRQPTRPGVKLILGKVLGWAGAWSLGWLVFWALTFLFLFIFVIIQNQVGREDFLNFMAFCFSGLAGGFAGGSVAGLLSMLALRPYAPSITWKHISPTIRIWAISGPAGMIISGILTVFMLIVGIVSIQNPPADCASQGIAQCLGQIFGNALGETIATVILIIAIFLLLVIITWFLTGMFAGWLVVRHVRTLEPGITRRQGWSVSAGWGCGAIVAALIALLALSFLATTFGL